MMDHRGPEELYHVQGQWPRGANPHLKLGAVAETSYPMPEVRGCKGEEQTHIQGQGWWLRGGTLRPRKGSCTLVGGLRGVTPCSRSGAVTHLK